MELRRNWKKNNRFFHCMELIIPKDLNPIFSAKAKVKKKQQGSESYHYLEERRNCTAFSRTAREEGSQSRSERQARDRAVWGRRRWERERDWSGRELMEGGFCFVYWELRIVVVPRRIWAVGFMCSERLKKSDGNDVSVTGHPTYR